MHGRITAAVAGYASRRSSQPLSEGTRCSRLATPYDRDRGPCAAASWRDVADTLAVPQRTAADRLADDDHARRDADPASHRG